MTDPSRTAADRRRGWAHPVWLGALVVGATAVAYLPALKAGFVWNDIDYVTSLARARLEQLEHDR
jgi:hypothetical protein